MTLDRALLEQFTGSDTLYRHSLARTIRFTEGVRYLANAAGAYWLLDLIVSHQLNPKVSRERFQVWKLTVTGSTGVVVCEDGNDGEVTRQEIPFTDFPEPGITLWFTDRTILLPSEY